MLARFTLAARRRGTFGTRLQRVLGAFWRTLGASRDSREATGQIVQLGSCRPVRFGPLTGRQAYSWYVFQQRLNWERGGVRAAWSVHDTAPVRRCSPWEN